MRITTSLVLLSAVLSTCLGLPTLEALPTTIPTTVLPTATATGESRPIEITGDVYVRDSDGNVVGWLYKGDQVQAVCSDDWCQIEGVR